MKTRYYFLCSIAFLLLQCAPPVTPVDTEAEKAAVLKADTDWAKAASTVEGHVNAFADDAVVLATDEHLIAGKASISEMLTGFHGMPGFQISWKPNSAVVSSSGDMAYTLGTYNFAVNDSTGQPMREKGKYVTVWTKKDGMWKVAVDAFNADPAD